MRLQVEHITKFSYDSPVYETATEIRLRPCDSHLGGQRILDFSLTLDPPVPLFSYTDYFGNTVHHINLLDPHDSLEIVSRATVISDGAKTQSGPSDDIHSLDFLSETNFVHFNEHLVALVNDSVKASHRTSKIDAALDICSATMNHLVYEPGVTDVHSPSSEVLDLGRGVCQDFAHVMIAGCRHLGIPARYVSGYLYGGLDTERDDRESHAWCEVYGGRDIGWLGLDPTHASTYVDERYVKIGVGRDYGDVTPVRGTFKGSATETLSVIVRMREV
jgi:transglutaminase-like putative cysteine protease